ncbi:MAG TPA: 4Fe-4S binding protein [Syntrophales bacterium]|nr:4Fe-4S binding protein [Syntrophales bacterium]
MKKETRSAKNEALIDFHSPEFNHTDDLTDLSGDYRFFEPLDGIVTSDMRYQMERLREEGCGEVPVREAHARKRERKKRKEEVEPDPDLSPLTLVSEGRTLIVDTDIERAARCGEALRRGRLTCTLVLTGKMRVEGPRSFLSRLSLIEADDVSISGAFGGFSATVTSNGEERLLADGFDLILDLRPKPSFAGKRLPAGYYAPGEDPADIASSLAEMPEMRGRFKKPRFTAFIRSRCLHGRSRTLDCRRCIDVCPSGAIHSEEGKILVNHYLCQGCSACVLVCPTDAMEQIHPPREELLNILEKRLSLKDEGSPLPTAVVISDGGITASEELPSARKAIDGPAVNLGVEEIGHVGMETMLFILSNGADRVVVACNSENDEGIRDAVAWQVYMARAILSGLGMEEDKCRLAVSSGETEGVLKNDVIERDVYETPEADVASSVGQERRTLIREAAHLLADKSGNRRPWLPLPAGSCFGTVTIDSRTCTLCMACVSACPSGALAAGGDTPRIRFVESRCHQCGLCRETCPERAVQLVPRMMLDLKEVDAPVVLCEEEVFRCVKCGAAFATKRMVDRVTEKLKEHWMYANERQQLRLKMCRACRTRDALSSEDMMLWNR